MPDSDRHRLCRTARSYYLRHDVQDAILQTCADVREVACRYVHRFGRRPDTLHYPGDIEALSRKGATSFHLSVERWTHPRCLRKGMTPAEMNDLRAGWDLIIDLDSDNFMCCTEAAAVFVDLLREEGIRSPYIKFSGNQGWHILVPQEWFPSMYRGKPMSDLFPAAAASILDILAQRAMLRLDQAFSSILPPDEYDKAGRDPCRIVQVDRQVASPRHLIRAPYSLHEKSALVSVPVDADRIRSFCRSDAEPLSIVVDPDSSPWRLPSNEHGGGENLLDEAVIRVEVKNAVRRPRYDPTTVIADMDEKHYPPCIQNILCGLSDGRKRGIFLLTSYLKSIGLHRDEVKAVILEWNARNKESLPRAYLEARIRNLETMEGYNPPNCDHPTYYKTMGVCSPDTTCLGVKNPITYGKVERRRELIGLARTRNQAHEDRKEGEQGQAAGVFSTI